LKVRWGFSSTRSVQTVCQFKHVGREEVAGIVDVLTQVNAAWTNMAEHFFKRDDLLFGQMPPIVHQNINCRDLLPKSAPEVAIGLITNEDLGSVSLVELASWLNVNPVNSASRPKIVRPHVEAAAAVDSHLHNVDLAANELFEVAMVDFKVMVPFPDASARLMSVEVRAERILLFWRLVDLGGSLAHLVPLPPLRIKAAADGLRQGAHNLTAQGGPTDGTGRYPDKGVQFSLQWHRANVCLCRHWQQSILWCAGLQVMTQDQGLGG
jgi:hypothetical protein